MKAVTAAEKYAYVSAFTLAMGEDPEHDSDDAPRRSAREPLCSAEELALKEELEVLRTSISSIVDMNTWFVSTYPLLSRVPDDIAAHARAAIAKHAHSIGVTNDTLSTWAKSMKKGAP
jgi:hypothetical protein